MRAGGGPAPPGARPFPLDASRDAVRRVTGASLRTLKVRRWRRLAVRAEPQRGETWSVSPDRGADAGAGGGPPAGDGGAPAGGAAGHGATTKSVPFWSSGAVSSLLRAPKGPIVTLSSACA